MAVATVESVSIDIKGFAYLLFWKPVVDMVRYMPKLVWLRSTEMRFLLKLFFTRFKTATRGAEVD